MKIFLVRGLVLFSCILIAVSGDTVNSTTKASPTTEITTKKSITTSSTTSTTEVPTTKPTTTTSTTSTSTTTTTTTPSTTTSPAPTPSVPDPESNTYKVNVTNTKEMIIVKMAMQVEIMYNTKDNKTLEHIKINVPNKNHTTVSATSIGSDEQTMTISWPPPSGNNSVVLSFKKNDKTYVLESIKVSVVPQELPNINYTSPVILSLKKDLFNTSLGNSYRCARKEYFNLTQENDTTIKGKVLIEDLQFQPFKEDQKESFGYANDCALETPDIVPIAVGCVLAGLVVIVLAAYLVTHRRSQSRGYLSM